MCLILKNKTNDKIIGIEHFYCDILNYKDSNNSLSKTKNNYLEKERKKFCKSIDKEDCLPKARVCIENETNELINYSNNFNYSRFIKNFKNIFDNHLEKVNEYKEENCIDKIGFIIEIPILGNDFIALSNGNKTQLKFPKRIPLTIDIKNIINHFDKVDFVIFVFKEYMQNKYISVKFYTKDSLNNEKIIYDSFTIKKINKKIHIKGEN